MADSLRPLFLLLLILFSLVALAPASQAQRQQRILDTAVIWHCHAASQSPATACVACSAILLRTNTSGEPILVAAPRCAAGKQRDWNVSFARELEVDLSAKPTPRFFIEDTLGPVQAQLRSLSPHAAVFEFPPHVDLEERGASVSAYAFSARVEASSPRWVVAGHAHRFSRAGARVSWVETHCVADEVAFFDGEADGRVAVHVNRGCAIGAIGAALFSVADGQVHALLDAHSEPSPEHEHEGLGVLEWTGVSLGLLDSSATGSRLARKRSANGVSILAPVARDELDDETLNGDDDDDEDDYGAPATPPQRGLGNRMERRRA